MQIINCSDKPILARGGARQPVVFGQGEHTFPARSITLPPKELVDVGERDGELILETIGKQGVIRPDAGETLEDTIRRGRRLRYNTLRQALVYYRHIQAQKAAQGIAVDLMSEDVRQQAVEMLRLKKELGTDPAVVEAMQGLGDIPMEDPLKDELAAIGMPGQSAPMVPHVPDLLSGITGVG